MTQGLAGFVCDFKVNGVKIGADPGFLAVSPQVTGGLSHKPSSIGCGYQPKKSPLGLYQIILLAW